MPPEGAPLPLDTEHAADHFRELMVSHTRRLESLCGHWEALDTEPRDENEEPIPDAARGHIRAAVGKARLLISQRFRQFSGLVTNCEKQEGDKKVNPEDLQGFWDMIYIQVEDVYGMFSALEQLQANQWREKSPSPTKSSCPSSTSSSCCPSSKTQPIRDSKKQATNAGPVKKQVQASAGLRALLIKKRAAAAAPRSPK
jgi:hypothetical protein